MGFIKPIWARIQISSHRTFQKLCIARFGSQSAEASGLQASGGPETPTIHPNLSKLSYRLPRGRGWPLPNHLRRPRLRS